MSTKINCKEDMDGGIKKEHLMQIFVNNCTFILQMDEKNNPILVIEQDSLILRWNIFKIILSVANVKFYNKYPTCVSPFMRDEM